MFTCMEVQIEMRLHNLSFQTTNRLKWVKLTLLTIESDFCWLHILMKRRPQIFHSLLSQWHQVSIKQRKISKLCQKFSHKKLKQKRRRNLRSLRKSLKWSKKSLKRSLRNKFLLKSHSKALTIIMRMAHIESSP